MYASQIGDRRLNFAVSGMLWQRSLVMIDKETESLWSHLLGRCMRGELKGEELEIVPSVITDWKTWRRDHPNTTVLMMSRTSRNYKREFYKDPSRFVLGMASGADARAWSFDQLLKQPIVNDEFNDTDILIVFDKDSSTAFSYERRIDGRKLSFRADGKQLIDDQTNSHWEPTTGRSVVGPLKGSQLRAALGIPSYRKAWDDFHPDSEYWQTD